MARAAGEDYKPFYFASLRRLLEDKNTHQSQTNNTAVSIPHSKKPTAKKTIVNVSSELVQCGGTPLVVDPIFLTGKKEWGRSSLAHNNRSQLQYDKEVEAYRRETKQAISQLQNSKSYHTQMLRRIQDRQMKICKDRIQERILYQAQFRYDKAPILETKRFCGACSRRPKSARAGLQVTIDGPVSPQTISKECCMASNEHCSPPPKRLVTRKVKSAQLPPRISAEFVPESSDSRLMPSPEPSAETPRPVSPFKSFDFSSIPAVSQPMRRVSRLRLSHSARL